MSKLFDTVFNSTVAHSWCLCAPAAAAVGVENDVSQDAAGTHIRNIKLHP